MTQTEGAAAKSGAGGANLAGMEHEVADTTVPAEAIIEEELLVEEISIDGMCGVY